VKFEWLNNYQITIAKVANSLGPGTWVPAVKSNNLAAGTLRLKFPGSGTVFRGVTAYFNHCLLVKISKLTNFSACAKSTRKIHGSGAHARDSCDGCTIISVIIQCSLIIRYNELTVHHRCCVKLWPCAAEACTIKCVNIADDITHRPPTQVLRYKRSCLHDTDGYRRPASVHRAVESDCWPKLLSLIALCEWFSVSSTASFWLQPTGACYISLYLQFNWNINIYAKSPFTRWRIQGTEGSVWPPSINFWRRAF